MNSKFIVSLLLLSFSIAVFAQEPPLSLNVSTVTYTPLADATLVNTDGFWDDPAYVVPIGFDIELFGETFNTLYFTEFVGPYLVGNLTTSPLLVPYGSDIIDRSLEDSISLSPIVYQVDGTSPNRIFKMEWQNAGFYNEVSEGINQSFVNFQLWLYEEDNVFAYHFGPSNIVNDDDIHDGPSGPILGFATDFSLSTLNFDSFWYLIGEPSSPQIALLNPTEGGVEINEALNTHPVDGQLYTFTPFDISIIEEYALAAGTNVFPNPVTDQLQIQLTLTQTPDQLRLRLMNSLGQLVHQEMLGQVTHTDLIMDMKNLPTGLYHLELTDGMTQVVKTVVKQ